MYDFQSKGFLMQERIVREGYAKLTELLISRKLTITTMESATSGQIASLITDTQGASAILKGAFITYSNEAKIMQGVSPKTIEKFSVYSKETASEMAQACRKAYSADIGLGVTGTMGNTDPANPDSSRPGEVYFAIAVEGKTFSWFAELEPQPSRLSYKLAVAEILLEKLLEILNTREG